jgi:hypothetical protein
MIRRSIRCLAGGLLAIGLGAACSPKSEPSPSAHAPGKSDTVATATAADHQDGKDRLKVGPAGAPPPGRYVVA